MSLDRIREYLSYDPETGVFTWAKRTSKNSRVLLGSVAGFVDDQGYRRIEFCGVTYKAHRLAWWWMHGEMPEGRIDHKDTDRDHNRIANLRPATRTQNLANQRIKPGRYKGVTYWKPGKNWKAQIRVNNELFYLGYFKDPAEAARAYDAAALKHFGEYALINFPQGAA